MPPIRRTPTSRYWHAEHHDELPIIPPTYPDYVWILPTTPDAPALDTSPGFEHPPQQPSGRTNYYPFPTEDRPRLLVYYRGPPLIWAYEDRLLPWVSSRVRESVDAHRRRAGLPFDYAGPIAEGTYIHINYADIPIDVEMHHTREAFGMLLQDAVPTLPPQALAGGNRVYTVSEWDIVCRRCGTHVRQYCTDEGWCGRYLAHLQEPECLAWEMPAA
ncbi:hypothetical protein HYPSUDRAFT_209050 [Hypholoma sublateritium FD-334 SS-4]|uniref:Uncharacterized protein n=1 Tax=Hypholoma sublateritium (strain FD-334 SS-4) TaxID=945553 RepID=A0A0D2LT63_HYPSF|nr:hypothetical protein HYPSUDRAFT_209050 [Hypholoma sublateritium FD-334 SS-4]